MKLSTKSRYALRAMLELGLNYKKRPLLLKEVAKRQDISLKYLDHIFSVLKNRGLLVSAGKGKGYALNRPPAQISIYDIFESFEDSSLIKCVDNFKLCKKSATCCAKIFWNKLSLSLKEELLNTSLDQLIKEQNKIMENNSKEAMYYI